jgi:hypothetical protein
MTSYKPHYACFACRKTFKRRLLGDVLDGYSKDIQEKPAICPECSSVMADMGLDFKSPKKKDTKAWNHIATLYSVGVTFHSCGCSGPGYIPNDKEQLKDHFIGIKNTYLEHQYFWARRKEDPETQSQVAKDQRQNWGFLGRIPQELKKGTKNKPKYDAEQALLYWSEKVAEIEKKIELIVN